MASDNAYGRASQQALEDLKKASGIQGAMNIAKAHPLAAGLAAVAREGYDTGFSPGWTGRAAKDARNTVGEGLSTIGGDVGALMGGIKDPYDKYVEQPLVRELQSGLMEMRGETPKKQDFDSFNNDFINKNFPEISQAMGSSGIQLELQKNRVGAVEGAIEEAGHVIRDLKDQGFSKQQVQELAKSKTQDPKELEMINSELEAAYGGDAPTGPVSDSNINAVADKVAAARNGADPTANTMSPELEAKTQLDEGAIYQKAIDDTANTLHNRHTNITPQNWYESRSFNASLIRFGLGLLSGEDYATAFSHAAQDYEKLSSREKREAHADELISEGYSKASVMQWIDEGKANILAKPKVQEKWTEIKDPKTGAVYQQSSLSGKKEKLEGAADRFTTYRDATSGSLMKRNERTGDVSRIEAAFGFDEEGNPITTKPGKGSGSGSGEVDPNKNPMRANAQVYAGAKAMDAAMANWDRMVADTTGGDMSKYGAKTLTGQASQVLGTGTNLGRMLNLDSDVRKTREAEEGFLQAYGRVLSGGAIKDEEWYSWGNTFFPRDGDTPRDELRKQFMRDNMGLLISNMYYQSGRDPRSLTKEELATLPADAALAIQSEAGDIFNDVVDYIPKSGNRPAAYVLADGSFWLPNKGIVSGGS